MLDFISSLLAILIAAAFPTAILYPAFMLQRKLKVKYKTSEYSSLVKPLDKIAYKFLEMHLLNRIFLCTFIGLSLYKMVFSIIEYFS